MKKFIIGLLLLAALCIPAFAADGAISSMKTTCVVDEAGNCHVTQTATIDLPTAQTMLVIPAGKDCKKAELVGMKADKSQEDGYTLFTLTNDAGFSGTQTFTVEYTLSKLVTVESGEEEDAVQQVLSLPLLSPKWDFPIESYAFSVTLPENTNVLPSFTSGYYADSIEDYLSITVSGKTVTGTCDQELMDHESMLMTLTVPNGFFSGVSGDSGTGWVLPVLFFLFAAAACAYWVLKLRSPYVWVHSRQTPPDAILPSELPTILCGEDADIPALILHWAALGYLTICEEGKEHIFLRRCVHMGNERQKEEYDAFRALFLNGEKVDLASREFQQTASLAGKLSRKRINRRFFRPTSGNPDFMKAFSALALGISCVLATKTLLAAGVLRVLLCIFAFPAGAVLGWLLMHLPQGILLHRLKPVLTGAAAGIALLAWLLAGKSLWLFLGILLCALTAFALRYGPQRTESGETALSQAVGYRRFLQRMSSDYIQQMLKRDPQYYYKTLSAALALGLSGKLSRRLSNIGMEPCGWLLSEGKPVSNGDFYKKLSEIVAYMRFSIQQKQDKKAK